MSAKFELYLKRIFAITIVLTLLIAVPITQYQKQKYSSHAFVISSSVAAIGALIIGSVIVGVGVNGLNTDTLKNASTHIYNKLNPSDRNLLNDIARTAVGVDSVSLDGITKGVLLDHIFDFFPHAVEGRTFINSSSIIPPLVVNDLHLVNSSNTMSHSLSRYLSNPDKVTSADNNSWFMYGLNIAIPHGSIISFIQGDLIYKKTVSYNNIETLYINGACKNTWFPSNYNGLSFHVSLSPISSNLYSPSASGYTIAVSLSSEGFDLSQPISFSVTGTSAVDVPYEFPEDQRKTIVPVFPLFKTWEEVLERARSEVSESENTDTDTDVTNPDIPINPPAGSLDGSDIKVPLLLFEKFPFSLPKDLYNIVKYFSAEPKAPHFVIPFMSTRMDLDLAPFEPVAKVSRTLFLMIYAAGLIVLTRKVMM